jgi:hypothetical protein
MQHYVNTHLQKGIILRNIEFDFDTIFMSKIEFEIPKKTLRYTLLTKNSLVFENSLDLMESKDSIKMFFIN